MFRIFCKLPISMIKLSEIYLVDIPQVYILMIFSSISEMSRLYFGTIRGS